VLPAFIHKLQRVAVRVDNSGGVIAGIVIKPCARRAIIFSSRPNSGGVGFVHFHFIVGDKSDMCRIARRFAFPQPEKYPTLRPETVEVGMPRRAVFAVVIDAGGNAERAVSLTDIKM